MLPQQELRSSVCKLSPISPLLPDVYGNWWCWLRDAVLSIDVVAMLAAPDFVIWVRGEDHCIFLL